MEKTYRFITDSSFKMGLIQICTAGLAGLDIIFKSKSDSKITQKIVSKISGKNQTIQSIIIH